VHPGGQGGQSPGSLQAVGANVVGRHLYGAPFQHEGQFIMAYIYGFMIVAVLGMGALVIWARIDYEKRLRVAPTGDALDAVSRRPWQLLLVGPSVDGLDAAIQEKLARILDLFPNVDSLSVDTASGGFRASRDFPGDYTAEVDQLLGRLFRDNPAITGIGFPATTTRPAHTATPDAPYWHAQGAWIAQIQDAIAREEITPQEGIAQLTQRLSQHGAYADEYESVSSMLLDVPPGNGVVDHFLKTRRSGVAQSPGP
jgi:hypothetical protein